MLRETESSVQAIGATLVGSVSVKDGDFVARDKIEQLINTIEQYVAGNYVAHQEVRNIYMLGPGAMEAFVSWSNRREGLTGDDVRRALSKPIAERTAQQMREFELAQQAAPEIPLTGESAYQFGMAAAYRRDYAVSLAYFGKVPPDHARFIAACESIAWLQQSLAMHDIQHRDYASAVTKLDVAKAALDQIGQSGVRTHELYGYIAKSMAQIAEQQGDAVARERYLQEAATQFERALELDPNSIGAANGLGNVAYAARDYDRAIEASQRAIQLAPNYTAAFNDLGLAYVGKLQTDTANRAIWLEKAVAAFRKAAELAVNDPGFEQGYPARIEDYIRRLAAQYNTEVPTAP